ncbi:MAG: histidine phosphatase family protein [Lachnospiraceae bacterium]|nr:histidine phosphatase family protein [Lachnospiraceae bacterium]
MIIYLVRHGETNWNKEGRVQGSEDIPLNEYGIELAEITSEQMKEIPVDVIFSSPLIRAQKTAEIMRRDRKIEIITDARLREMGFGVCEGTLMKEAIADENNPLHNFISAPGLYEAKDGENFSDVIARARSFMEEVLLPAQGKYETVMLTAHGAFIRCFLRCIEERPLSEFWNGVPQRNCAVTIIELKNDKFTVLEEGKLYY